MPRILLLRIDGATYGLEIESIQELVDNPPWYSVPQTGAFLLGVINLRGQVLPVIDLPGLLGMTAGPRDQRLVVLSPEFHRLALTVSGIGRIAICEAAELHQPTADQRARAVAGVVEIGGLEGRVNLLDAGAVVERLKTIYAA
jgi:purine-binding chemotaxis protein CheW